jgi:hypothetical protein
MKATKNSVEHLGHSIANDFGIGELTEFGNLTIH